MSDPEPSVEQALKADLTKEELERKKIELEIKDLERPFWKRPTYILAGLPTLLAVATLSVGLFNGYFSASLTKLDNHKHDLEAQIKEFEARRDALHAENDQLRIEKKSIEDTIKGIQQGYDLELAAISAQRSELEKSNKDLASGISGLSQQKEDLENRVDRMQSDFDKVYSFTKTLKEVTAKLAEIERTRREKMTDLREITNALTIGYPAEDRLRQLTTILERMRMELKK